MSKTRGNYAVNYRFFYSKNKYIKIELRGKSIDSQINKELFKYFIKTFENSLRPSSKLAQFRSIFFFFERTIFWMRPYGQFALKNLNH